MKIMDADRIKQILANKLLQTIYSKIYLVDLSEKCCGEWSTVHNTMVDTQSYDNWLIALAEKMYKSDAAAFFVKMHLDRICASITETTPHYVVYYRYGEKDGVKEFRLSICYTDELHTHLVFLREGLSEDSPRPLEALNEVSHGNARFEFLVEHLVMDFIEINIDTRVCRTFSADNTIRTFQNYDQQIAWWAEHIIVAEERAAYLKEYDLDNLVRSLRKNNGRHHAIYSTAAETTQNSILIFSKLMKENCGKSQEYIFAYAQDISQLRAQEARNKQLVGISQQLLALSQTEPLTGLYNRAACEKMIEEHLAATAKGTPGAMLLIDIDHFKEVNDQYGHPTGDFVLKFLGKTMQDIFRSDDIISRWGGDEFVVFMRDVRDQKMIVGRIERLRVKLSHCKMNGRHFPITISIGGKMASSGMPMDMLFGDCDKALYQVKTQGRNGFIIRPI